MYQPAQTKRTRLKLDFVEPVPCTIRPLARKIPLMTCLDPIFRFWNVQTRGQNGCRGLHMPQPSQRQAWLSAIS